MKKNLLFFLLSVHLFCNSQEQFNEASVVAFQQKLNEQFANKEKSPLKDEDFKTFITLNFFPINSKYAVLARLIPSKKENPFEMPTTTSRRPMYIKYGELHFRLEGKKLKLNVYRNLDLAKMPEHKNTLFLPYTDNTSGIESYGGGRYINLEIPKGKTILLDFNKSYNPYCVYNEKYSCPIVPQENDLNIEIKAGVKKFKDY